MPDKGSLEQTPPHLPYGTFPPRAAGPLWLTWGLFAIAFVALVALAVFYPAR